MVTEKTIAEMANLWKEEKRQFVKKSTYAAYSLIVETHILSAFGDLTTVTEKMCKNLSCKNCSQVYLKKQLRIC